MGSGVDSLLASRSAIQRHMNLVGEARMTLERSKETLARSRRLQQAQVLTLNLLGVNGSASARHDHD